MGARGPRRPRAARPREAEAGAGGEEGGGGAAALSHTGSARPPLPGAEVTAARDGRPQPAARRAEGPLGGGEQVRAGRGARVADPGRRAEGTRTPRDAPRGPACATRFPEAAAAVAGSPPGDGGGGRRPSSEPGSGPAL